MREETVCVSDRSLFTHHNQQFKNIYASFGLDKSLHSFDVFFTVFVVIDCNWASEKKVLYYFLPFL